MHRKKPFPNPHPISPPKRHHLLISMALISLLFISLLIYIHPSTTTVAAAHRRHPPSKNQSSSPPSSDLLTQACKATRNQPLCQSSLSQYPNTTPLDIIQSALSVSLNNIPTSLNMVQQILNASKNVLDHVIACQNCVQHLTNSQYRLKKIKEMLLLSKDDKSNYKQARAWTSAGLAYQYDCWSALKYVNDTKLVNETMSFLNTMIGYTSNALSLIMADDVYGDDVMTWKGPRTERDGFWETGGGNGLTRLGVSGGLKVDVSVCKNGGCDYKTVQEAVNVVPGWSEKRFVIWVKEGVYEETVRVGLEKQNVVVYGDGIGKTVITGSLHVGLPGLSTFNTATFGVSGDRFMASGLTIENTAGPDAHQAVAFVSDSDQSVIENCEFLGNQDTLYAHSLRQFYKSCHIEGNVDFIFGNSASIFQECTILVRPRQLKPEKGENNAVTAQGRIDPAQTTGFVFQNCLINGTVEYMRLYYSKPKVHKNFLGRPWKEFSRTIFIDCNLEALISAEGWMPWTGDFALKTLYYGEFGNTGKGSDLSGRVSWSSRIPDEHVDMYSVGNFLQGLVDGPIGSLKPNSNVTRA